MLLFFYNDLQVPSHQASLRIPCSFICHAFVRGKLFRHFRSLSTFTLPTSNRTWGNDVVYGSIHHVDDWRFYSRILDAYHTCSLSSIGVNHRLDIMHRVNADATPIKFSSLSDFSRLKYKELDESIPIMMYVGNTKHPKIASRIKKDTHSYRITSGVDVPNFIKAYEEVQHAN